MEGKVQQVTIKDPDKKPQRFSAKLIELTRWGQVDEVNSQLDGGFSPNAVHRWVQAHGFKISQALIYEYADLRKRSLVEGVSMERLLGVIRNPIINTKLDDKRTAKDKLRSELDALDEIIQRGYENLKNGEEKVSASTMMAAIKLKNDLTEGTHGFLTNYGMEHLKEIETQKYALVVQHLLTYIPKEKRHIALRTMAKLEEQYYFNTDYYEEYLRAAGSWNESQIQYKLEKWKNGILADTENVLTSPKK